MSLKTFLSKIWAEVNYLFENLPAELKMAAQIAVTIVENLKMVIDNPAIDILTAVIPGDLDNDIVAWLRIRLPVIINNLRLADNNASEPDGTAILILAAKNIQNLTGDFRHAFLHDLGVLLAQELAKAKDKELSWADAVYLIEWYYQHKFKKI